MDKKALSEGFSFENKRKWDNDEEKKPDAELPEEPEPQVRGEDVEQLLRQERLGEKHSRAVAYNVTGGAFNVGGLAVLITGGFNVLASPDSTVYFTLLNDLFGFPYTQEQVVAFIEEWKAHLVGMMVSLQTFLAWWQQVCKQMKLNDTESVFQTINEQCGKMLDSLG